MTTQPSNTISDERNFHPQTLEEFVGQSNLKKTLRLMLDSAHQRSAVLEHVVFYGGPGLGKRVSQPKQLQLLDGRGRQKISLSRKERGVYSPAT